MNQFQHNLETFGEIGFVESVSSAVAYVSGLPNVCSQELVSFETGSIGLVLSLQKDYIEVLLFTNDAVRVGTKVARTKRLFQVKVGKHVLGSTIDSFGKPLDPGITWDEKEGESRYIDSSPPGIAKRKRISKQFDTGVSMVDLVVPLGKGQRQLIIGDRKTGKTNFLMQTIVTQASQGAICIYVGIGKKQLGIKKVEEFLKANGIYEKTIVIASFSQDPAGVIYVTPYTGMMMAEYFAEQGSDVLLILDDLTTHARYYREVSLLIKRFPGRNSYPADIFYAHARLLERAGNFIFGDKENSITCFPVAETVEGDLSGYIQTNLMSMTDGHLYFDHDLFEKGRRPAVHPFLSVTRVGRQTQSPMRQSLNREITSFLSLYDKMQNFSHFGSELSTSIANTMQSGEKILGFFEQLLYAVIPVELQVIIFSFVWIDRWRDKSVADMKADMKKMQEMYEKDASLQKEIHEMIESSKTFNELLGKIRGKSDEFYKRIGLS